MATERERERERMRQRERVKEREGGGVQKESTSEPREQAKEQKASIVLIPTHIRGELLECGLPPFFG